MPSFDIVSQVNSMELENAVNQAKKELANRFDFKGFTAEIVLEKDEIKLSAEDQFKISALDEMVFGKLAKRGISMKNVDRGEPDISPLGHARQSIKIKQGIEAPITRTPLRLLNPYVAKTGPVATNEGGAAIAFKCPSDNGAKAGVWKDPKPTVYENFGSSHFYNASANSNDGSKGLMLRKVANILNPTKIILANDFSFNCYFDYGLTKAVFEYMYWHDKTRLGYGNVLFNDSHVGYHQATTKSPDFQRGPTWSFLWNDE